MLTGQISAENEASLAFRIGGRVIERLVDVGARVEPDQVLARLDPQNELNALRSAQATLSAAEGKLVEASNTFDRQRTLLPQGSRRRCCSTRCSRRCARRNPASTPPQAQLHIAKDRVGYTSSKAGGAGSRHGARRRARRGRAGGPDDRPDRAPGRTRRGVRRAGPGDPHGAAEPGITCRLTDDPASRRWAGCGRSRRRPIRSRGHSGSRVGLTDPPPAMRLGSTVTGRMQLESDAEHRRAGDAP